MKKFLVLLFVVALSGCGSDQIIEKSEVPFTWDNANIYFLLTDRFCNGDPGNDLNFDRSLEAGVNRGFMGGDLAGVTQKIREDYFDELGITAIWTTPFVEQNHGITDEGTGPTYGYHGYWTQDWTRLDPNFGSEEDLAAFVEAAHEHGIRVIMDVVINHTGPVTGKDPAWGSDWVRLEPTCQYKDYLTTTTCTLVDNLPDIKTESNEEVELPQSLLDKWYAEGRLEQEIQELDEFFERTGYPRTPTYYIIKWLTDYIRKYGIDAYRLDTVKHVEESVWAKLRKEADAAYAEWKAANSNKVLADIEFFIVGEVYNYGASSRTFDFGDTLVDYYDNGINSLINFEFKSDVAKSYEEIFSKYSDILHGILEGYSTLNYLTSHDDSWSHDKLREDPFTSANKLILSPGACQVYYGDETSRVLSAEGAVGDANLRSFMNWDQVEKNTLVSGYPVKDVLTHWQKLGRFRKNHPAVGAGVHTMLSDSPYVFLRSYEVNGFRDEVVVGLDLPAGNKTIKVGNVFKNGELLTDAYSGKEVKVKKGEVNIDSAFDIVLLARK